MPRPRLADFEEGRIEGGGHGVGRACCGLLRLQELWSPGETPMFSSVCMGFPMHPEWLTRHNDPMLWSLNNSICAHRSVVLLGRR
jgi:hypothetical protein